ncbi:MAG: DUF1638 domain-containing protein [Candidatus Methanomethylophilaceae archaeon]|nr:DUF1638 domain-containing protein [Candidatus Methanomethylophilaceae archaeon]
MTHGRLGIILCPMVDDNLMYSLKKDPEEKHIFVVKALNNGSIKAKLDKAGIPYEEVDWDKDVVCYHRGPDGKDFGILIYCIDLGLHSKPKELKVVVEGIAKKMQPYVDAIGFYLGTCGNFEWNIPKWCEQEGLKPGAMFCDKNGELCHDCVGINIAGGPKYLELEKKYAGHLFMFPAMATNYDEFMNADQAEAKATEESLTDEMREALGIEPGRDGYMRWLLQMGGYQYILKLDTGIGDRENFEPDLQKVAERTHLDIKVAEDGWADLQPTDDLYSKCKSMLGASE